jgi:hypothetical protein
MARTHRLTVTRLALTLVVAVALATAAGLEGVPTDSRLYDDFDLLKTSGLIHSMPSTSRPWTRGECVRLLLEARSVNPDAIGPAQLAALKRLEFEFGSELPALPARRPSIHIPIPDLGNAQVRCDFFSRVAASRDRQRLSLGAVINNDPGFDFAFYERFELTAYQPRIVETELVPDSSGLHIPGTRVLPYRDLVTLETELAYVAFKLPWLRLELGRDEFFWGPGYSGSVMLDDIAPALDHVQIRANYRNFKFLTFTSLLSRWGSKPRFLAAQRIEFSLWNRLTLGGAMMVVSAWDALQPTQLGGLVNPLIPLLLSEANSASEGNSLIGWDAVCYLPRTKIYGQLCIDDYNSDNKSPVAVATQVGAHWAPNLPVDARLEYTRIAAFTYYHRIHSIMFENNLTTMGHPLGPDADLLYAALNITPNRWLKVGLAADYTRRGYYNRGDYDRMSYDLNDTTFLKDYYSFPAVGQDSLGNVIEQVDKTVRFAPGVEIRAFRDLFVSLSVGVWRSHDYQGAIGLNKDGVDLALKVEYRY